MGDRNKAEVSARRYESQLVSPLPQRRWRRRSPAHPDPQALGPLPSPQPAHLPPSAQYPNRRTHAPILWRVLRPLPPPRIHSLPLRNREGGHSDRAGLSRRLEPWHFPDRGQFPTTSATLAYRPPPPPSPGLVPEQGLRMRVACVAARARTRGGRRAAGSACARGAAGGWRRYRRRCCAVSSAGACPCGRGTVNSNFSPSSGRDQFQSVKCGN